jgi:hypothetical protein
MHVVALDAGSLGGNLHHTKEVARVDRGYQPQLGVETITTGQRKSTAAAALPARPPVSRNRRSFYGPTAPSAKLKDARKRCPRGGYEAVGCVMAGALRVPRWQP